MKMEERGNDQPMIRTVKLSFRRALTLGIFFLFTYLLVLLILKNQPETSAIFSYAMISLLYIVVAFILYLAMKSSKKYGKRTQIAWAMLMIAVLTSVLGNIIWGLMVTYYNQNPASSIADILYLLFYPLFLIGIIIFPSAVKTSHQRFKRYFDILIIMFSLSLVLWIFFIQPAIQSYNGEFNTLFFMIAYVLGGFLLFLAMLDLIFNRIKEEMNAPFLILLIGTFIIFITNTVYAYQTIHGTYISGGPGDLGWIIGYLIIGLAGVSQFNHQKLNLNGFINKYFSKHTNYIFAPYIALAGVSIGYISLIWAYNTFNPSFIFLEFGVGVLIFLVVARQFISINENKYLYWKAQEEISLRKEISKSLKDSELAYRTIFENTGTATVIIDEENIISLANTEFENLSGYNKLEIEGIKKWTDFVVPEDIERMVKHNHLITETESDPRNYEFRLHNKTGSIRNIFVVAVRIPGSKDILLSLLDLTDRKNAELEIKKSLEEKETLLKEIHHRVKNNLTVISSLLNLQSRYIKDKDDLMMFMESQSRAKSMALIHKRLYDSTDLKRIDFGDYINTLANEMFKTYVPDPNRIKLNLNVEDIMLDINTAIPLGLILNELLTNCMKYAFPQTDTGDNKSEMGHIHVNLYKNEDGYTLSVEDDGKGFPEDIDIENTDSLGLQLINSLTNQIDAEIQLNRTGGTSFKINFNERKF
jgi:PAS domain S-box-containing protein